MIQIFLFLSTFDRADSKYPVNFPTSVSGCRQAQQTIMFLPSEPSFFSIQRVQTHPLRNLNGLAIFRPGGSLRTPKVFCP